VAVVEHEGRAGRWRAKRPGQRRLVRARYRALGVGQALQPLAVRRPQQQARRLQVEAPHGAQLGGERRVCEQRVRRRVAGVAQRGHAADRLVQQDVRGVVQAHGLAVDGDGERQLGGGDLSARLVERRPARRRRHAPGGQRRARGGPRPAHVAREQDVEARHFVVG
jgi:hypothetical protein